VKIEYADPSIAHLAYAKTNLAGWFFDAFLKLTHNSELTITEHPVESGANVADHAFMEPREVIIEVGMTDCAVSIVPGQFEGGWSRSVEAYKVLLSLQQNRIPFSILTRLGLYENMLVKTLLVPDDYAMRFGLKATATCREILVAETTQVKVSAMPQKTGSTYKGQKVANESNLSQIAGWIERKTLASAPE
jgi:hypothetical protein